ncbi:hypothetical protein Tco_1536889, partial [Tanacetum coccineum]
KIGNFELLEDNLKKDELIGFSAYWFVPAASSSIVPAVVPAGSIVPAASSSIVPPFLI